MKHLVQYSTGVASAELAWRLVAEHGRENVTCLTADTLVEHKDNWRFAYEVHDRLLCEWIILTHGRTPMQIGRDVGIVPNNRMAVCSRILKRELLRGYINEHFGPAETIVYEGYDWTEQDRIDAARPHWLPYRLAVPLAEPPYTDKPDLLAVFRSRGIEPPWLYSQNYTHANCSGCCVRGGQAQWELTLRVQRPLYLKWEEEEEESRALLGKDVSILRDRTKSTLRPLTLRRFREELDRQPSMFDADDWGACGCKDMSGSDAQPAVQRPAAVRRFDPRTGKWDDLERAA